MGLRNRVTERPPAAVLAVTTRGGQITTADRDTSREPPQFNRVPLGITSRARVAAQAPTAASTITTMTRTTTSSTTRTTTRPKEGLDRVDQGATHTVEAEA